MRRLFLIRHAKSSWSDPAVSDFERTLNNRGEKDGPFMAEKLAQRGVRPDMIVASPAVRAKKTAVFMALATGYDPKLIVYEEDIYESSAQGLYAVLRRCKDSARELFLVGHNYAITDLAVSLTREEIENIPTSGIVAIECPLERWSDLAPGCAKMLFFDYPKRYRMQKE